ncbi:hypothetical protein HPY86_06975 [candidate division WOR-3 bacterium]|nr:hypothetical protein [candidate division WOR-3 bacterium]
MKFTDPVIIREGPALTLHCIAFDSLGVKGMCTRIETPDIVATIDPGVSAQTDEFPLPEEQRLKLLTRFQQLVRESCVRSQILIISHYHLDHFIDNRDPEIYSGKVIFAKAINDLPKKQQETARRFFQTIDGLPKEIIWADGRRFKFKKTEIGFSAPLWHGKAQAEPGKVIMTDVRRGKESVLISSDVAGPIDDEVTTAICQLNPQQAVIDGYPSFLQGDPVTDIDLLKSIINLCRILSLPALKTLILDHHIARDYRYPALFKLLYDKAKKLKKQFGTVAELTGQNSVVIDALKNYGTTRWHRWQPIELETARTSLEKALTRGKLTPEWLNAFNRWILNP